MFNCLKYKNGETFYYLDGEVVIFNWRNGCQYRYKTKGFTFSALLNKYRFIKLHF